MNRDLDRTYPGSLLQSIHNSADFCALYMCITRRIYNGWQQNVVLFCSTRIPRSKITQTFEELFDDQIVSVIKTDNE